MGRLFLLLEKEYNKHRGLVEETQSIQQDLRMIAAAMDDQLCILGRDERTAVARLYSEEILDLAHDIEDCVDRFMHRLRCKQRRSKGRAASSFVNRVAHELKKVQSRSSYADEIHKLKRRIKEAHQRVIEAIPRPISCSRQPNGLPTTVASSKPCHVTRKPVGIEKPMEELQLFLDDVDGECQQLRVISIVGFGGSGKTTLARAVYDSPHTMEKFHCRAWVAATDSSLETRGRVMSILNDIHQQVVPRDTMDVDNNNLEVSLKEYLTDKRYLIVIDDVKIDEWKIINSAFEESSTSSRIMLTTNIQSVANMCSHGNGYVYQMDTLGVEDSKKIAFSGIRSPELEHGSAALLAKCGGLPLALVSVSDYLKSSSEPTGELCAKLCRNLGSFLKEKHGHDNFSDLRKVLLENYDSLSGYALSCFLYLGIFPNNRPVKRKVLTRRWVAEGYARSESLHGEEDIADEHFNKLMDWNIMRPIETRNNSQVKTCKTHGIMHEFVTHKSSLQRFIMTFSPCHPRVSANANNARHLSIHAGKLTECAASDEDLTRVRSLTVFRDAGGAISYIRKCKLIRVLDLEECNDLEDYDLKNICKLWHLKYLSLGNTIKELPRCIDQLHCLETLDLRRTKIKSLPVEAIQLPHLKHLFGKIMLDKDDLNNVKKMNKLEKFLSGKKSNLQTLAGFVTEDSKGFLQLISHMIKLRKVKIWCKQVANSNSYIADLSKAIQKFTEVPIDRDYNFSLSLDSGDSSEHMLSSIKLDPCSEGSKYDLKSLKLHGKFLQLPPFVIQLSAGITDLCISSATLTHDLLSALATLGRLLYLKLIANELENFKIKQGIDIKHLKHLKEVTIDAEATEQTRQDWECAAKKHRNRPRVMLIKMANPVESEELENCAIREKRKRCPIQPNLDDGLDSSLKKMRLSESFDWTQSTSQRVMETATMASSSNPIPRDPESGSWMKQPTHP
ncbi:hypothetical protein HU200_029016 [Digitaria exilis]|uniref:Uncharacterized protein n=1 Tax=Digitaria exilis TaxID=1010633 RepID=A0A835BR42_9POAL|nr:hypothetical protein HU200_029016 [Digitaria exilis]